MSDPNGPWSRKWNSHAGVVLMLKDGPRQRPYLRIEDHSGTYIGLIYGPRTLRSIGEALLLACDRARPRRKTRKRDGGRG
jgi:hypothetical protein